MVYGQACLDGLFVVVLATAFLAAQEHAFGELLVGHFKADYDGDVRFEHFEQGVELASLGQGAGEAVEDYAVLGVLGAAFEQIFQDLDHQFVRNEHSLRDIAVSHFADVGAACYVVAQHVASRNMEQAVLLGYFSALCALAAARATKNNKIEHIGKFINLQFNPRL